MTALRASYIVAGAGAGVGAGAMPLAFVSPASRAARRTTHSWRRHAASGYASRARFTGTWVATHTTPQHNDPRPAVIHQILPFYCSLTVRHHLPRPHYQGDTRRVRDETIRVRASMLHSVFLCAHASCQNQTNAGPLENAQGWSLCLDFIGLQLHDHWMHDMSVPRAFSFHSPETACLRRNTLS